MWPQKWVHSIEKVAASFWVPVPREHLINKWDSNHTCLWPVASVSPSGHVEGQHQLCASGMFVAPGSATGIPAWRQKTGFHLYLVIEFEGFSQHTFNLTAALQKTAATVEPPDACSYGESWILKCHCYMSPQLQMTVESCPCGPLAF